MSDQSKPTQSKVPRVEAAVRDYLERIIRGESMNREEFISRHPEIADALRSFIASEEELRKLAGAEDPRESTGVSTRSFAAQGEETFVPQAQEQRAAKTEGLSGEFGRYRILRVLGSGAMGTVYLADDTQLERRVAIKTPHFTESRTEESLERFYREARVAATLRQPNICPVFDVGQIDGKHYISMAYIEGLPLSALIKPDKPQTERQILIVIRKLAIALQEAHDHGIVHRDLKPANIMVDKKGEPIIMDFGMARQARRNNEIRLTQTGNIIGTPAYMAPEQVEGEPDQIGPATDQYSLGVILYELLTAQLPFRGSVIAVMAQILTKEPPRPRDLRPGLDSRIEAACMKMMAKIPADRFGSMSAVADALACLIREIDEADRPDDGRTALKQADELLKIEPGHPRAREIQEKFSGYRQGSAARIGRSWQFTQPWNEGGWIPWSVLAFGLAVFGVMTALVVFYLNGTAVVIDIKDPGVEVAVKGTTLTVTGPDKQPVKVVPGDQELTITSAGLETTTKSFTIKKGETKAVTVSIVNSKLVARLEDEVAPLPPAVVEKIASTLPTTFKNSLGMEFVLVPKGKSWLGGGGGRPGDQQVVIAHDFYLGKYEVTQEEWKKVTRLTPSHFSRSGAGKDMVKNISDSELKRFPLEQVSWDDTQVFLDLLNKREQDAGWVYRLPKGTEWEYACRGGPLSDKWESTYAYYFDKPTNQMSPEKSNFGKRLERTCQVGSFQPNRLGLYDMHGNVWEWCDDVEKTENGAPSRGPRGGGWSTHPISCTAAYRLGPALWEGRVGLRVARVPVGKEVVKIRADGVN